MAQIFTGAPIWVWPLLIVLIAVGMRARRTRFAPTALIYALPLLAIMPLRSTAELGMGLSGWAVFAVAYAAGAAGGFKAQRAWLLGFNGRMVRLAGESLTLAVMMVVFWSNFVAGFMAAVAPQLYDTLVFQGLFVAILAVASGSFAGRAAQVFVQAPRARVVS